MFTIVYVLTSNPKDYYYQQLMISLLSLRKYMPDQPVKVITDDRTYSTLQGERSDIFEYAEVCEVEIDGKYSQKERSRFIKTSLVKWVDTDFLFVDSDTVICDDFSRHSFDGNLAMALDRNCGMKERPDGGKDLKRVAASAGFDIDSCETYFNSGVMWVRNNEETKEFFAQWHKYWIQTLAIGMCVDQLSLNYVNTKICPMIRQLDGVWNCQVSLVPAGIEYLSGAHIIHYFNTRLDSPHLLCNEKTIRDYKSENIISILENPKGALKKCYLITVGSEEDILLNSKQYKVLLALHQKFGFLYRLNEKVLSGAACIRRGLSRKPAWDKF